MRKGYREDKGLKSKLERAGFMFSRVEMKKKVDGVEYSAYLVINQGTNKAYQTFEKDGEIKLIGVYANEYDEMMDQAEALFDVEDFSADEVIEFITDDVLHEATRGRRGFLLRESAGLIQQWLGEEQPDLDNGPMTKHYAAHQAWAEAQGLKPYGYKTFANIIKNYKSGGGIPGLVQGGGNVELIQPVEYDEFEQEILDNEVYYKFSSFEFIIEQIAKKFPGFNNAFVFGTSGVGKTFTVKEILDKYRPDYYLQTGGISGYTGLMKLLYDHRKDEMVVLDDCDNLLEPGKQTAHNILKAALGDSNDDGEGGRRMSVARAGK